LASLRKERKPFWLSSEEFDEILRWKLASQYGRQRERRRANTDEVVRAVTGLALSISHPDDEYATELRVGVLCALRGVSVPVASAVLALAFPEKYCVIDFRGWWQVFEEHRAVFSIPDYHRYLAKLRALAAELGWPVQEADLAVWDYDRRHRGSRRPSGLTRLST